MIRRLCDRIADGENREDLMNFEWSRYETYKTFPNGVSVSLLRLARAGFYYVGHGQSDKVKCFSCRITHSDWIEFDDPFEVHRSISPSCEFVRGTDGDNVPIHDPNIYPFTAASTGTTSGNGVSAGETSGATGGLAQNAGNRTQSGTQRYASDRPKFPRCVNLKDRIDSFVNSGIDEDVISTGKLAEAGFFYAGFGDCVRCFYCGIGLRNWEYGDDPWIEHAKHFTWCNYLLEQKGERFILEHSDLEITEAIAPNANASSTSMDEKTSKEISGGERQGLPEKSPNKRNSRPNGTCNAEDGEENKTLQKVQKELEELKDKLLCKICCSSETNIVFLPCGHMISCQACAPHILKCGICRQHIEGRKKIFLS